MVTSLCYLLEGSAPLWNDYVCLSLLLRPHAPPRLRSLLHALRWKFPLHYLLQKTPPLDLVCYRASSLGRVALGLMMRHPVVFLVVGEIDSDNVVSSVMTVSLWGLVTLLRVSSAKHRKLLRQKKVPQ